MGIDERMGTAVTEGRLRTYNVTIGTNETQMRLNDTDAAFYAEQYKCELAEEQDSASEGQPVESLQRADADESKPVGSGSKARSVSNKLGGAENK